jgi:hypothetical protein
MYNVSFKLLTIEEHLGKNFSFGFWNCAISPPGQNDPVDAEMVISAFEIIKSLFEEHALAIIFLCEINVNSFTLIEEMAKDIGVESIIANDSTPTGSKFDLACLYLPEHVQIEKGLTHVGRVGTSRIKVAQTFSVIFDKNEKPIHFLLSHWPSRLQDISKSFRNECSIGLRMGVVNLQENNESFILLGDYNDDPYSETIFDNLRATNDRSLVITSPDYWLYNPFWRTLYARSVFSLSDAKHDFGTCYSKANNRNSWSSFDQILFSGDFLKAGDYYINEENCKVISDEKYVKLIMSSDNNFDHLPIIGSISIS